MRRMARPTTPPELDGLAAVTPEDVARAQVAAERDGSALLVALLDARADA